MTSLSPQETVYMVKGMTCQGCAQSVRHAVLHHVATQGAATQGAATQGVATQSPATQGFVPSHASSHQSGQSVPSVAKPPLDVNVDLASGRVLVKGAHDRNRVMEAIRNAGFDLE